jgi:hypothetical protein
MEIIFTNIFEVPDEFAPVPAGKLLPDWYKNLDSFLGGEKRTDGKGTSPATAKRCMPMFDAMTAGYIIVTHCDLKVSQVIGEDGEYHAYYEWPSFDVLTFHTRAQLPMHPLDTSDVKDAYPKWMNTWAISTPPGYSCLIMSPLHSDTPIAVLPGVVDTDSYKATVHFPFVLKNPKFEGIIPAGTPLAQVIPIKRESWQLAFGKKQEIEEHLSISKRLRVRIYDSYKTQFRQLKEYR